RVMPGILCCVYDPNDTTVEPKWRRGLELVQHHPEHVLEQFNEPGIELACIYHPEVCQGPRILVTVQYVLACYGNVYEDDLISVSDGESFCRNLLDRILKNGVSAIQHLNGRYDIAVWDRCNRVLNFVSDRFGANRHYLLKRPAALHIACEIKALAPFQDRIEVDPAGLASMLSFGYHLGDLTLLQGISCLPNARNIEHRAAEDHLQIDSYWNYPYGAAEPLPGTESELAAQLHDHLLTALKSQLRGVKKILLPISGGLDSRTMAGLLAQSGFSGEVLAYSYGQSSSRDVRYGRAIARKLGYPHVTIPTPRDFMTRHLEQAAWRFDGEWPADSNWGARFGHTHPVLGDTRGYTVLSGMYGDVIMGSDRGQYRRQAGDAPVSLAKLREVFIASFRDMPIDGLLMPAQSDEAEERLSSIVDRTLEPLQSLSPFFSLLRAEFIHRQRRHTATVAQSVEYDLRVITPFLDRRVVDFSDRLPYRFIYNKLLYKCMLRDHLPAVAEVPYADTGLPISDAPLRAAVKWRIDRLMKHFPRLQRSIARRNAFFDFHGGVYAEAKYFRERLGILENLSPPLLPGVAEQRMDDLLIGKIRATEQVTTLLPPAQFIHTLRRSLYASIEV
ncbi:MAG TPA: asparagine synthase-related protein, partial [Anaerolineae bacterium]|nr:asparagine synthase-related protein [Anaerolineae bacterium]